MKKKTNLSFTSTLNFYLIKSKIRRLETLADTHIQIIWWPVITTVVPDTLSQRPPMDPSCSTPSPAASPTVSLDTNLVVSRYQSFLVCLLAA